MRNWGEAQLRRLRHPRLAEVIRRNVESISITRGKAESNRSAQQQIADWVTRFAGSMVFVYLHVAWFAAWIGYDLAVSPFDPSFTILTMIVSLEAIFLSTFVLVSQNRQSELADQRAELDLQINLLSEYETTRILKIVSALAEKAGLSDVLDLEIEELKHDVAPEDVMHEIESQNGKKESSNG